MLILILHQGEQTYDDGLRCLRHVNKCYQNKFVLIFRKILHHYSPIVRMQYTGDGIDMIYQRNGTIIITSDDGHWTSVYILMLRSDTCVITVYQTWGIQKRIYQLTCTRKHAPTHIHTYTHTHINKHEPIW